MCSDPSTVFRYLSHPARYPAGLSPFFPTSLRISLLRLSCCLSFPPGFAFSPPHSRDVRESSPFLRTCWESSSLQGDGIRCRSTHETGCSSSLQATSRLTRSRAQLLRLSSLSLFASTRWVSFPPFAPLVRSIGYVGFASCRVQHSSIRLLCARMNHPRICVWRNFHEMVAHGEIYLNLRIDKSIFVNGITMYIIWGDWFKV